MPAAVRVNLYVCANHLTSDCFSNEGQDRKRISPNHTGPGNHTRATSKCCHSLIEFIVACEYGEVNWKLAISQSAMQWRLKRV